MPHRPILYILLTKCGSDPLTPPPLCIASFNIGRVVCAPRGPQAGAAELAVCLDSLYSPLTELEKTPVPPISLQNKGALRAGGRGWGEWVAELSCRRDWC